MQARRDWSKIFTEVKGGNPTNLKFCTLQNYPSKVKKDVFKQKLRLFIAHRPTLQEVLQREGK